ncbi:hypothetical protein Q4S01_16635, partial [Morganella morganii]
EIPDSSHSKGCTGRPFSYTPPQYQSARYHLTQELCAALKNAIYVMYERFTTGPFRHALLPCKQ